MQDFLFCKKFFRNCFEFLCHVAYHSVLRSSDCSISGGFSLLDLDGLRAGITVPAGRSHLSETVGDTGIDA